MSRSSRIKAASGIYHIMLRGMDGRNIFSDDEDCKHFLSILKCTKEKSEFDLYAWCLMGNHVHLLIREGAEPIEKIFKRLGVSYVRYYNKKYNLRGHLFQDRFRSEAVDTQEYFLDCLRYICQNPVKARLVKKPFDYEWLGLSGVKGAVKMDSIKKIVSLSDEEIVEFSSQKTKIPHMEEAEARRITDKEAISIVRRISKCSSAIELAGLDNKRRDKLIKKAIKKGVSIRQLSRISGVNKSAIELALKNNN